MKFVSGSRRRAKEYEAFWVKKWQEDQTFEQSVNNRSVDNSYVFYDGPPFITGVPHYGTLLSSIVKDIIPRYQTMKGKRVERVWGWDCHGLPAENFTEKKLGITSRQEIGKTVSLEKYITTCRDNMVQTGDLWESTIDRIGRWVDFKGAYKTMDKDYMESVWWAFKTLYDKGKIYEGERVLMYDTNWQTPLSKAEVTMDTGAYQDVTDPSLYVKFKIKDQDNKFLLAWTTTPWTLPANVVLAVNPDFEYAELEYQNQTLIMANDLVAKVMTDAKHQPLDYKINQKIKGSELVGLKYEPLFENHGDKAHTVYAADYVSKEDGTGIVHTAPAYGEDDFNLAQKYDLPVVHAIDDAGNFTTTEWAGQNIWQANKQIAKTLVEDGRALKVDYIRHQYPHNPRTNQRLIYRAHPSWFMDIAGQKDLMLEQNQSIEWFPKHVKEGRFAKTVQTAPDWNLSRDRFWATAMPVWEGVDKDGHKLQKVVGSYQELKELSGVELEDYHRPWVDDVEFEIDGVKYQRVEKVLDCWFESGSMPFAQFHYPFENKEKFEANFPGDFITEYVGQVRAWFYYMHAVSNALFGTKSFRKVIVTGTVAGNDGRKMSKSYGNYTDPNLLMDQYSADSLRFLLLQSPLLNGEDYALLDKDVADIARKLTMIWNMYDFFTMYAEVDDWQFAGDLSDPLNNLTNELDRWVVSRLHETINSIENNLDNYNIVDALKPILLFIEDASNWYVRRSRRRFWKSEDDTDKNQAYQTLHYVLARLAIAMAPITPFLSEELYQKMVGSKSVHLLDWVSAGEVDQRLIEEMALVREVVNVGLYDRVKAQIKVRQPLAKVIVKSFGVLRLEKYTEVLKEELNVKSVELIDLAENTKAPIVEIDTNLTPELKQEGMAREIIRAVQNARKSAGLDVDNRIILSLISENQDIKETLENQKDLIAHEVLATELSNSQITDTLFDEVVKIEKQDLKISFKKA